VKKISAKDIVIRRGRREDLPAVLGLIRELAAYERAPNEVEVTLEEMDRWSFGHDPIFEFFAAVHDGTIVGIGLYYYKYSTWKGKCLFLEDLIVTEAYRGYGLGTKLFDEVVKVAKEKKVRRMEWQVLDWNEPAIRFYKRYNALLDPEWLNGKLTYDQLQAL
jgi:GNAT superfamily N-acetyltransferase